MKVRLLGLTLIEVMVAVAISAILATLAAPSFTGLLARRELAGIANQLSTDIYYARSEAVARNLNVTVAVEGNNYTLTVATSTPYNFRVVTLAAGYSMTAGTLTFSGLRGLPNPGYSSEFTVSSSRVDNQLRLMINPLGRVSICAVGASWGGFPSCPQP